MIKRNIPVIALLILSNFIHAGTPTRKGWWKFDNSIALASAENGYGQPLTLVGTQVFTDGPEAGNGAVKIGPGSYYKMFHGIGANGGGTHVNEYSLQYDFKIAGNTNWYSFFQTAVNNGNDGDFFINPTGNIGVGDVGYSGYKVVPEQWYRLVISVKNGDYFTCYLDGKPFLSGITQGIDGRFSLGNPLLIFADENGEDGEIYCSELAIWDQALNATQVLEMGGFGHVIEPVVMTRIPYLQSQGQNEMTISWHDDFQASTIIHYGTDSSLALSGEGSSEVLKDPYCWHTVKITGLEANTRYFYKVGNGNEFSATYSFKTLPDDTYSGKLRFILLSDTHASDSAAVNRVLRSARNKIKEMFGPDIENHINGIFHSGDIVVNGSNLEQYTTQYFKPLSILSANIPTMVVAGNHEGENKYFYQYLKLDDHSAFPQNAALNEKVWYLETGNTIFIGLNTNIIHQFGLQEAIWLDTKLKEAENNTGIDFVFLFMHHFPFSELWNVTDESIDWVKNTILPILTQYTKVRELHYGHTHGYERGTIMSDIADGDYSIICTGGGGGALDPWNVPDNHNYNDIHISYSDHFFQILEIDIAGHSYQNAVYGIGDEGRWKNAALMDIIYRKSNQMPPETPTIEDIVVMEDSVIFLCSEYSGPDSLMSAEIQVLQSTGNQVALDTIMHWKDIFGIDAGNNPVDRNLYIPPNRLNIKTSRFISNRTYTVRARYRDHNFKWSDWSTPYPFSVTATDEISLLPDGFHLYQNFPNPFENKTTISYYIPTGCDVRFMIYDTKSSIIATIDEGKKDMGKYSFVFDVMGPGGGVFYCRMITPEAILTRKMVKIKGYPPPTPSKGGHP